MEKIYPEHSCITCGEPSSYSILLAVGEDREGGTRFYLPNLGFRENEKNNPVLHRDLAKSQEEKWFCRKCMRTIEDNFRATIQYLQTESELTSVIRNEPGSK